MKTDSILLETMVSVSYTIDDPSELNVNGKHYPITIKDVKLNGKSVVNNLSVHDFITLQRRTYIKLADEEII